MAPALDTLPPEMIEHIARYLECQHVCNLRLVSSVVNAAILPLIGKSVYTAINMDLSSGDKQRLLVISKNMECIDLSWVRTQSRTGTRLGPTT